MMGVSVWLASALLGAAIPLGGTVVDEDGRPVARATVWLGDTHADRKGPDVLGAAEADDEGRFRLERPDDLTPRGRSWSPTLWAYLPGRRLGFVEFKQQIPGPDEAVRVAIGPPASMTVRVLTPEGRPAARVVVLPNYVKLEAPWPPGDVLARLAATTDADGRATIDGLGPEDVGAVDVKAEGQVVQTLTFDPKAAEVSLRPLGRLRARLVADDPAAAVGWKITASTLPEGNAPQPRLTTSWAREVTDAEGRVEFPPLAQGLVSWRIEPPEGSTYLAVGPPGARIEAGATADVEIPLRRCVRVEGVVREEPGDAPIPGVAVHLIPLGSASEALHNLHADDRGRISALVPPGTIRLTFTHETPPDYFLPPGSPNWVDFEAREGERPTEFTPPRLRKAAKLAGSVRDERDQPVFGATVTGEWSSPEFDRAGYSRAETDVLGNFTLGSIAPGAEVRLAAELPPHAATEPLVVAHAGEGGPISLRLRPKPARSLSGSVLDAEGRPLAGASIQVLIRGPEDHHSPGTALSSQGPGEDILTGPDGRYRTPPNVPNDVQARVRARAEGHEAATSPWLKAPAVEVAAVTLRRSIGVREVAGRVVDVDGRPLAGAAVFKSGDGPGRGAVATDAEGRFRLRHVPDAPELVFVVKDGCHRLARPVGAGPVEVELTLGSLDGPPGAPLGLAAPKVARDEERAIALDLLKEAGAETGEWASGQRATMDAVFALAAPDRAVERIENQVIEPTVPVLESLAIARWEEDPRKVREILDAVGTPQAAASVAVGLVERLASLAPDDLRREWLELAEARALAVEPPVGSAGLLARIADRWFDLGEADRGGRVAREAAVRLDLPREYPYPDARAEVASALARADLPAALALLEKGDARQVHPIDTARIGIAERIAATDPAAARRLFGELEEARKPQALRPIALRMAAGDLASARELAAEDPDPVVAALMPAAAARARAATDPESARELLRESIERLARLEGMPDRIPPYSVIARLLPLAGRIDPERVPDVLALALTLRPILQTPGESSSPGPSWVRANVDLAELAVRAGRHDRAAAEVVFAPVAADLVGLHTDFWGLGPEGPGLFRAAGAFDAKLARSLLEALPDDPEPLPPGVAIANHPSHHSKAVARLALAQALALPPALRLRVPPPTWPPQPAADPWLDALDD